MCNNPSAPYLNYNNSSQDQTDKIPSMVDDPNLSLQELREIILKQQELLRLVLYVQSEGSAEFMGERFTSTLERDKARAVAAVSMGAGQSMNTVLKLSHEQGISARDMYPIARAEIKRKKKWGRSPFSPVQYECKKVLGSVPLISSFLDAPFFG